MMRNHFLFISISLLTTLLVVILLFYSNSTITRALSFFWPEEHVGKMILFYGDGCDQCVTVNDFVKKNKVEDTISFVQLEVFNSDHNADILRSKAKKCGLNIQQIGVPFIFDDQSRTCVIGSVDIINFFKTKLK